jgi:pyruvate/2-oxoglutarate dehydrogenase complex dihydrolipoamide dehydrogenase (E3) component
MPGGSAARKTVMFEHDGKIRRVTAEEILFALGRVPNIAGLAHGRGGGAHGKRAHLTNARMQTSAPHIFAVATVRGRTRIVHLAIQQGEIAAHNLAAPGPPRRMDYRLLIERGVH